MAKTPPRFMIQRPGRVEFKGHVDHRERILEGATAWNAWRARFPEVRPDLRGLDIGDLVDLSIRRLSMSLFESRPGPIDGFDLRDADLTGAQFGHKRIVGTNFAGAILRKSTFQGTQLVQVRLSHADMRMAFFYSAKLQSCSFRRAVLRSSTFYFCSMQACDFLGADLVNVHLASGSGGSWNARSAVDGRTVTLSGWSLAQVDELVERGLVVTDVSNLTIDTGLSLTFDTRLHRFASSAIEALILEVLGPDTDVGVEEQSRPDADGPGFVRINGSRLEDLMLVAEAFYARAWNFCGQTTAVHSMLDEVREGWTEATVVHPDFEAGRDESGNILEKAPEPTTGGRPAPGSPDDPDVQEMLAHQAKKHRETEDRKKYIHTRWRRLLDALAQDTFERSRKLVGKRTFDTGIELGQEIIEDVRKWWDQRSVLIWNRKVSELEEQEAAGLLPDHRGEE